MNGDWKKNLEDVAYETEKSLLPATQGIVEERKEQTRILGEIRELDYMMRQLRQRRRNLEVEYNQGGSVIHSNAKSRHFVRACPDENCRGFLSSSWKVVAIETLSKTASTATPDNFFCSFSKVEFLTS